MAIRFISLFVVGLLLTACTSSGFIYDNPFELTPDEVDKILSDAVVLDVSLAHLQSKCPVAAAGLERFNSSIADCVFFKPKLVYLREDLSGNRRYQARRHAASHFHDVYVRGASIPQSSNHYNW